MTGRAKIAAHAERDLLADRRPCGGERTEALAPKQLAARAAIRIQDIDRRIHDVAAVERGGVNQLIATRGERRERLGQYEIEFRVAAEGGIHAMRFGRGQDAMIDHLLPVRRPGGTANRSPKAVGYCAVRRE